MSEQWQIANAGGIFCAKCNQWYRYDTHHDCTGQTQQNYTFTPFVTTLVIDENTTKLLERIAAALETIAQEMTKPGA